MKKTNRQNSVSYSKSRERLCEMLILCFGNLENFITKTRIPRATAKNIWNNEVSSTGMLNLFLILKACPYFPINYVLSSDYVAENHPKKGLKQL